jgi:hypothetical protein
MMLGVCSENCEGKIEFINFLESGSSWETLAHEIKYTVDLIKM